MARVAYVNKDDLAVGKRHIFDNISGSRGVVLNVFQALLNSPDVTEKVAALGEYLRYKSLLDPVVRETVILSVARELNNEYEWAQHEPVGARRKMLLRQRLAEELVVDAKIVNTRA